MTARKFEFAPSPVRVPQGSHVYLTAESLDASHGISIPGLDLNVTLPPHKKVTLEFYAKEAGTYPFRCSHFCGLGHLGMKGEIIVDPKTE